MYSIQTVRIEYYSLYSIWNTCKILTNTNSGGWVAYRIQTEMNPTPNQSVPIQSNTRDRIQYLRFVFNRNHYEFIPILTDTTWYRPIQICTNEYIVNGLVCIESVFKYLQSVFRNQYRINSFPDQYWPIHVDANEYIVNRLVCIASVLDCQSGPVQADRIGT